MSIQIPTIDQMNEANSVEHVFLGILRMLYTSDLAHTYMLLKTDTIEDICSAADRILSKDSIPEEFKTPTQLTDVERAEYASLAQRLLDEAKRLAPAPHDEETMDILRGYWMNSNMEDLIDIAIGTMPSELVKEVVDKYKQQQLEQQETDLEYARQFAQYRTIHNIVDFGMAQYKTETLVDIAYTARRFDFHGDVLLSVEELDKYVELIDRIDAHTGVSTAGYRAPTE